MKSYLVIFSAILLMCSSCDDCATDNCGPRPEEGRLRIKVNYNNQNSFVPITVYQGQYEGNNVFFRDTLRGEDKVEYYVPVDFYYSVTAIYKKNNTTITALDGGRISVSSNDNANCDGNCYTVNNSTVNVRLKY